MFNGNESSKFRQQSLWDDLVHDPGSAVKMAMCDAAKRSGLSRDQIVDKMNELAASAGIRCAGMAQKVTLAILDKWLAPGADEYHIPLRVLPLFCRVTSSNLPLYIYANFFLEAEIISKDDKKLLNWAKAQVRIKQLRKDSRQIEQELKL